MYLVPALAQLPMAGDRDGAPLQSTAPPLPLAGFPSTSCANRPGTSPTFSRRPLALGPCFCWRSILRKYTPVDTQVGKKGREGPRNYSNLTRHATTRPISQAVTKFVVDSLVAAVNQHQPPGEKKRTRVSTHPFNHQHRPPIGEAERSLGRSSKSSITCSVLVHHCKPVSCPVFHLRPLSIPDVPRPNSQAKLHRVQGT